MYKTIQLLDMVKAELDLPSDYALAKELELTRSSISTLRNGKHFPSTMTAYKIAQILYLNPLKVVFSCELERAKHFENEQMIKLWEDALKDY